MIALLTAPRRRVGDAGSAISTPGWSPSRSCCTWRTTCCAHSPGATSFRGATRIGAHPAPPASRRAYAAGVAVNGLAARPRRRRGQDRRPSAHACPGRAWPPSPRRFPSSCCSTWPAATRPGARGLALRRGAARASRLDPARRRGLAPPVPRRRSPPRVVALGRPSRSRPPASCREPLGGRARRAAPSCARRRRYAVRVALVPSRAPGAVASPSCSASSPPSASRRACRPRRWSWCSPACPRSCRSHPAASAPSR